LGITRPDIFLSLANGQVRTAHALRDDLLAVLFPQSGAIPSELLQSQVRIRLKALTSGIELALMNNDAVGNISWTRLTESGLLREEALIDFALARIAEDALSAQLRVAENDEPLSQMPALLLGHENDRIAAMARDLLHAMQMGETDGAQLHHRLDSEHFHLLCWRVAAALIEAKAAPDTDIRSAVQILLQHHDGRNDPLAIARKIVFFLGDEYRSATKDPRQAGLHLFIAGLCRDNGLNGDFIMRLMGADHPAALLLLLKASEMPAESALDVLTALKGRGILDAFPDCDAVYRVLDTIEARAAVHSWRDAASL
jgi:hypothetical protein